MNDRSIPIFGRALKLGSHLTVLHMENMYLSGRSLIILGTASAVFVSVCLNCLCAQHCISWHGIPVHLFFLSEIWFAKTNKCKSGVPRKKHFCKGPALCVCVREREDFGSNTLSQHCFFVVALFIFFCFLQNTGGVFFLHTVQSLILTQLLWFGMNYMYPCCIYIYMTWAHINSSCCTEDEWDSSRAVLGRQPSYAKWRHTAW